MGRAPRTKETLPDFREKCRVTRHSRVFPRVDGYSTDPRDRGVTPSITIPIKSPIIGSLSEPGFHGHFRHHFNQT